MTSSDIRAALLDEYLELKERVNPLEKRLSQVRDQLRDIVTEEGHFVDELRGVGVHVEARFRKETCSGLSSACWLHQAGGRYESVRGLRRGRDGNGEGAGA